MEESIGDNLCVSLEFLVGVYVCFVGIELLALYRECACIKYVSLSVIESSLNLVEFFGCALCGNVLIELSEFNRTCFECSRPVSIDLFALLSSVDCIFVVRRPVDSGRDDLSLRSSALCASVVRTVRYACFFACRRSSHGVGVLADEYATALDELVGAFLLSCLVIP